MSTRTDNHCCSSSRYTALCARSTLNWQAFRWLFSIHLPQMDAPTWHTNWQTYGKVNYFTICQAYFRPLAFAMHVQPLKLRRHAVSKAGQVETANEENSF